GRAARIDRLERRFEYGGAPEAPAESPQPRHTAPEPVAPVEETGLSGAAAARAALLRERQAQTANLEQPTTEPQQDPQPQPQSRPEPTPEPQQSEPLREQPAQTPQAPQQPEPQRQQPAAAPQAAPATPEEPAEPQPAQQTSQVEMVRRAWPEVLEFLKNESRLIWMTVNGNAQIVGFDGKLLTIGFDNDGARNTVQMRGGANLLAAGFNQVLGIQPELDLISGTSDGGSPKGASRPARQQPQPTQQPRQETPEQPPVAQAPQPTQNASQQAPPVAPQSAPLHPQPPATGVAGWGSGQPDQTWGQPEADWAAPDPNWGPPQDDDCMPDEDPWSNPPQDPPAAQPPPSLEQPAAEEPELATGPDPVASDGYAGFIPRNESTDEPAIPAFAKSEAELRQEFQRRFGDIIPGRDR